MDKESNLVTESNTKLVRWSDGTMSFHVGSEIFDIHEHPIQVCIMAGLDPS